MIAEKEPNLELRSSAERQATRGAGGAQTPAPIPLEGENPQQNPHRTNEQLSESLPSYDSAVTLPRGRRGLGQHVL